jgi:hypothetical protein
MDENQQDKTESKTPATEANVSVPSEKKGGMPEHNGTGKRMNPGAKFFKTWASPIGIGTFIAVSTLLWEVISFNLQQQSAQNQAEQQHEANQ